MIPSYILSILFMNFIYMYKLLILYKRKLNRHKLGYVSTINRNIEKQAIGVFIKYLSQVSPIFTTF